ncbi:MAG TPA: porphobilinogen synthase, partial [Archaeoglobaceae archaeon]|nr:porphobilinogen synthase [Archaeoglobaceae archaeon]
MRRLRKNILRPLFNETALSKKNLIMPVFVDENLNSRIEISSMPEYYRIPVSEVADEVSGALEKGIGAFIIFGIPTTKDERGSSAFDKNGVVQKAVRNIKKEYEDAVIVTDVCLCEYTTHGHCGIVQGKEIMNDETLPLLGKT